MDLAAQDEHNLRLFEITTDVRTSIDCFFGEYY